jgi:ABC-type nitrate/sulfonate/bicarbonate transport system permease component
MQAIIRAAGGKGDFKTVVLGTSAYEALYAGQVDFTEPFLAWEGIEAELRNEPLKTFAYADYKFPDAYSVIVIGNPGWMKAHPEAAAAFVGALQRGYQLGADDPAQGAKLLADARLAQPGDAGPALPEGRGGEGRHPDGRDVVGLLRLPVRRGCARGRRREAAHRAAGLRDLVHRARGLTVLEVRTRRWAGRVGPALLLVLVGLAVWQLAVDVSGVRPQVLPSPLRVVEQGWAYRAALWTNTLPTLQVTAVGFAVSLAVGWAIAVTVDFVPWLRRALTPLLVASQTVPIVAIAPLLIIWFGFGLLPKVVVIALVTFFPIAIGLIEGFAATDRQATNLLRSMGASRLDQFRYVRLPGAMPSFFTALRIGITYAVTGAIFAEYVGATAGLGIFMQVQKNSFRTDLVLAAVVVTAAVSVTLFALTYLVQRVVAPWSRR